MFAFPIWYNLDKVWFFCAFSEIKIEAHDGQVSLIWAHVKYYFKIILKCNEWVPDTEGS